MSKLHIPRQPTESVFILVREWKRQGFDGGGAAEEAPAGKVRDFPVPVTASSSHGCYRPTAPRVCQPWELVTLLLKHIQERANSTRIRQEERTKTSEKQERDTKVREGEVGGSKHQSSYSLQPMESPCSAEQVYPKDLQPKKNMCQSRFLLKKCSQ